MPTDDVSLSAGATAAPAAERSALSERSALNALGSLAGEIGQAGRYLTQSFRLMVGVPDYGSYVAHTRATHPDREPMSYEDFFRERQAARYGARMGRCC